MLEQDPGMSLVHVNNETVADALDRHILSNRLELLVRPLEVFLLKVPILNVLKGLNEYFQGAHIFLAGESGQTKVRFLKVLVLTHQRRRVIVGVRAFDHSRLIRFRASKRLVERIDLLVEFLATVIEGPGKSFLYIHEEFRRGKQKCDPQVSESDGV